MKKLFVVGLMVMVVGMIGFSTIVEGYSSCDRCWGIQDEVIRERCLNHCGANNQDWYYDNPVEYNNYGRYDVSTPNRYGDGGGSATCFIGTITQ